MRLHEDEERNGGGDVTRMFNTLPRERVPDPRLEERIVSDLRRAGLVGTGSPRTNVGRSAGLALTWPAAVAAAALLFASGVVVGTAGSAKQRNAPTPAVAAVQVTQEATPIAVDVLLAPGKRAEITRAIKF